MIERVNQHVKKKPVKQRIKNWSIVIILLLIYIWAFSGIPFSTIKPTAVQVTKSIFNGMFHPDWSYVYHPEGEDLLRGLLDTLCMALLGTLIAAGLSLPFSIWAAKNINRIRALSSASKVFLSVVRTLPDLVLALIFIVAVGPGAFAGVLALSVSSFGMLSKLFAEVIENSDMRPTEGLLATGANRLQTIRYGVLPQVLPEFLSHTLHRLEINIRSATILGMIGAGGIGTPLIFALSTRTWSRVGIILLGIILLVAIIDLLSSYIRKKMV